MGRYQITPEKLAMKREETALQAKLEADRLVEEPLLTSHAEAA